LERWATDGGRIVSTENKKPGNFDWVTARRNCSLQEVFEALKLGIRDDVKARNASFQPHPDGLSLRFTERGGIIRVYWADNYGQGEYVEFTLGPQNISVKNNQATLLEITVGLNDDGDCKARIQGREFDLWQVRRKSLETLMFNVRP
jgi:hypothetical protein